MSNLVLYHGRGCYDGFLSAFLMYMYFKNIKEEAEFIAVDYNQPIPDVADKNVFIVDFSYSPEVLFEAAKTAKSIVMLDHHLAARQQWATYSYPVEFEKTEDRCRIYIDISSTLSGCGLVADYLYCKLPPNEDKFLLNPRLIQIIAAVQDRDLWEFKLSDTLVICEVLTMVEATYDDFEELIFNKSEDEFNKMVFTAKYYLEIKEQLAQDYAARSQIVKFQGYDVPVINVPPNFTSRVGEILYQTHLFALMFSVKKEVVECSLRSNSKTTKFDVNELAKKYGGGGHRNAAGFKLKPHQLPDLLNGVL